MNAFAAYSDSEGSDAGDGTATEPAVFRPAWQQNDDSGSSEEEEGGSADPPVQGGLLVARPSALQRALP